MTINEQQEYEIFSVIIGKKMNVLDTNNLPSEIIKKVGISSTRIFENMVRDGFLTSGPHGYFVTPLAETRYQLLKKQKKDELFSKIFGQWLVLAVALVSAYYAAKAYYATVNPPPTIQQAPPPKSK